MATQTNVVCNELAGRETREFRLGFSSRRPVGGRVVEAVEAGGGFQIKPITKKPTQLRTASSGGLRNRGDGESGDPDRGTCYATGRGQGKCGRESYLRESGKSVFRKYCCSRTIASANLLRERGLQSVLAGGHTAETARAILLTLRYIFVP
jgi:hypothetical protein